jgi:hypothetical protein
MPDVKITVVTRFAIEFRHAAGIRYDDALLKPEFIGFGLAGLPLRLGARELVD